MSKPFSTWGADPHALPAWGSGTRLDLVFQFMKLQLERESLAFRTDSKTARHKRSLARRQQEITQQIQAIDDASFRAKVSK